MRSVLVMIPRSVAASRDERTRQLPGDELIPEPIDQLTHGISINRPRRDVWPWLAQMGAGTRGGWYSYDRLDNGGHPSATRVLPYLQQIRVGTLFPALPGRTDGFHVLAIDRDVSLVLGWRSPNGTPLVTWTFVLEDAANDTTRLITRSRASRQYPFFGLPPVIGNPVVRAVHFVMQRKQLLGIATRAEQYDALLDRVMPEYDILERHNIWVDATPDVALHAAQQVDLTHSSLIRTIVTLRAVAMGARQDEPDRPRGLIAETTSMGWRPLGEVPGRELVMGAVTQPWLADVTFTPLAPDAFMAFADADYVKIAWTLRVDGAHPHGTIFRTETRALATDRSARVKFRRYWRRVRPGVVAIRWILLRLLKQGAEANQLQSLAHGRTD
jgi:hypothetical protein